MLFFLACFSKSAGADGRSRARTALLRAGTSVLQTVGVRGTQLGSPARQSWRGVTLAALRGRKWAAEGGRRALLQLLWGQREALPCQP